MPSMEHESLLALFRNRPALAAELLRDALHVELPPYRQVRVASADLSEVAPAEYRADLVTMLVDEAPVLGIVLEVQLKRDRPMNGKQLVKAMHAPFAAIAGLLCAAEGGLGIGDRHVDMHHAGIQLARHILRPNDFKAHAFQSIANGLGGAGNGRGLSQGLFILSLLDRNFIFL